MTDINLLGDTDSSDENGEKRRQRAMRQVALTNPSLQKAQDQPKGGGLHDAGAKGRQMGKSQQQIAQRGVVLSDSFGKKGSGAAKAGGGFRSLLGRLGSSFQKAGTREQPPRILHAQYHDGSPAPHVAPPPPPGDKRTPPLASGAVRAQAPSAPSEHSKVEQAVPPPPPPTNPQTVAQTVGKKSAEKMTAGSRDVGEPAVPGVNLVPEELQNAAGSKNKLVMIILTAAITLLLIGVASVGMLLVKQMLTKQANDIKQDIEQMSGQRKKLTAQKRDAIKLHEETLQAMDLLNKHIYWTQFFKQLEGVTVDTVAYRSVTADQAGRVTILATGADFRSVARQLIAYQNDAEFIKEASITSASMRQEAGASATVDFTATITLQPGAFYVPPTASTANTPSP